MEWNTTWKDPLTSYVKHFDRLIGDQRTRKTFGETVKGIIAAGFLFDLGVTFDWVEVQLLAKLGG